MRTIQNALYFAGLALALVAPIRAAEFDQFLPNDTALVVSINVEQLLNSPLGKKYARAAIEQGLKDNAQAQEILKALNFDPLKDLARLTVASSDAEKDNALAILNGKFDREKVDSVLAKVAADQPDKVKIHKAGSVTVYEMINDEKKPSFAGFADSNTILAGPKLDAVKSALGGTGVGKPKQELTALFPKKTKPTAWLAALPKVSEGLPLPTDNPDLKKAIEGLDGVRGLLFIETSAKLSVTLSSKSVQGTQAAFQQLTAGLNFIQQMAPGFAKDKPELAPLFDALKTLKITATPPNAPKAITLSGELSGP